MHLDDAAGMARCSPWMDWVLGSGFPGRHVADQMARSPPEMRDYETVRLAHEGYVERMQVVEDRLSVTQAFLAGDRFTIADIPAGVELSRWSCGLENWARAAARGEAPQAPEVPTLPQLKTWFTRLQERPAFWDGCFENERAHHGLPDVQRAHVPLFGHNLDE